MFLPLAVAANADLEKAKVRMHSFSSFYSSQNASYVSANSAPIAQPDRATDF
jgi:hypothetical protein